MTMQQRIEAKLKEGLQPRHLEVVNESGNHNVPPGSETHFKVVAVAEQFVGKPLIARHRTINALLQDELQQGVHALALHTLTPEEWAEREQAPQSPPCLGGGRP